MSMIEACKRRRVVHSAAEPDLSPPGDQIESVERGCRSGVGGGDAQSPERRRAKRGIRSAAEMTMDRSEEDMLTAWEAGVVEAVVAAAREYVENEAMQAQACGVLSSVVYDATGESYQTWAGAAGAVEVVVVASRQHVGSARVQHLAYAGLARMVYRRAANK